MSQVQIQELESEIEKHTLMTSEVQFRTQETVDEPLREKSLISSTVRAFGLAAKRKDSWRQTKRKKQSRKAE